MFRAYEVKPGIYWVGALEWNERCIHGFTSPEGSTNNAYLILDEHPTLIDTCIDSHAEELMERISDVLDPSKIEYLVSNHSEKDHAGSINKLIEANPDIKIVTSNPHGAKILKRYYGDDHEYIPVKTGDSISIGKRTLTFVATPMVHWPDNMVTYCPEDTILFSNDAFGQFIATSKRFDDEICLHKVLACAKKYFANIITPYAKQTAKAVAAVKGLDLDMIAPSHGIIWRSHIEDIFALYDKMCALEAEDRAIVVYTSIYGSTERMAKTIAEAFMSKGIKVHVWNLDISDISDIMDDILFAKYVAIGSPTHNNTVLPHMGEFLTYFKGLAPKAPGRIGISFGSYGWTKAAQDEIAAAFKAAGFDMPLEPVSEDWNDTPQDEEELFAKVEELIG